MSKEAAATVIKLSDLKQEEIAILRQVCSNVATTINGLGEDLGEPLLGMFLSLKDQYNEILGKLPPTDAVPAAQEASWNLRSFLSCLTSTQTLLSFLTTRMADMKGKAATANSSLSPAELAAVVEAAIQVKVAAGDLATKETVASLCSAAKDAGIREAHDQAKAEAEETAKKAKLIAERRQVLATNSLPFPETDESLLGTEEEFSANRARAEKQAKQLAGFGLDAKSQAMSKAWSPEAEFNNYAQFLEAVKPQPRKNGSGKTEEPFAGGPAPGAANKRPIV
jgi:hypothetical protein